MRPDGLTGRMHWLRKMAMSLTDQALVAGSGFIVTVLLSRWLAPKDYGAYAVAFSIFLFIAGLHNALVLEPMSVFGPSAYRSSLRAYLAKLVRLHFLICFPLVGLLALVGAGSGHWLGSGTFSSSALWGLSLGLPWILFFWLWRGIAYVDLRPELAVRAAATYAPMTLILMLAFRWLGWLSPFSAFVLQAAAALITSAVLIVLTWPQLSSCALPSSGPSVLGRHWEYGRWVVVTAFVYWLSGGASYIIAGFLLGMSDVAALRALQNFVLPVSQLMAATSRVLLPWTSARFADQGIPAIQRAIERITLLAASAAGLYLVGVWLVGRWLIDLMYNGRYIEFSHLLPLVALPVFLSAASQGPAIAMQAMRLPVEISLGYTAAAVVNILAGVILTRYWGLIGNILGMSGASLAFLVVIGYRCRVRLGRILPERVAAT